MVLGVDPLTLAAAVAIPAAPLLLLLAALPALRAAGPRRAAPARLTLPQEAGRGTR